MLFNIEKTIEHLLKQIRVQQFLIYTFVFSLFLTFSPTCLLEYFSLKDFVLNYQEKISLVLFSSVFLLVIIFFAKILKKKSIVHLGKNYLKYKMSKQENKLLVETFFDEEENEFFCTGYIAKDCGTQRGFEFTHIIYLSSEVALIGTSDFPYNLQPYILNFLNKNLKNNKLYVENGYIVFS